MPIKAINLSLGHTPSEIDEQTRAIVADHVAQAHKYGINVVAAAGNTGDQVEYPAVAEGVFAVGAANRAGDWCASSARGIDVDISAVGCGVTLGVGEGGRRGLSEGGTSLSAPQVAAALVSLRDYKPELTWEQAENLLRTSATNTAAGPHLNLAAAFSDAGLADVIPPAAATPPAAPQSASGRMRSATRLVCATGAARDPPRRPHDRDRTRPRPKAGARHRPRRPPPDQGSAPRTDRPGQTTTRLRGAGATAARPAPRQLPAAPDQPPPGSTLS